MQAAPLEVVQLNQPVLPQPKFGDSPVTVIDSDGKQVAIQVYTITDTNGAKESVRSLFQRLKCMREWYASILGLSFMYREVSSIQGCP